MGISHEYHSTSHRARHGGVSGKLRLAGAVLAILVLAYAITAILENGASAKDAQSEPVASGIAQDILAPLPMQGEAADSDSSGDSTAPDGSGDAQAVTLETFGPARQDAAAAVVKAYDASVIRQPSCGQVDLNYFADAAFLGDSLTVGFSDYQINLGGALVCGYTGVGPDAIVNRTAVKSSVRGEEIPPVRPKAAAEKPGLASDVLRGVNEQLAQLAASKGCVYLDLWEALADGEGNLKEMLAAPDGVHLSAGNGYGTWLTYLRNHAKYSANNSWTMGSVYSAQ